MTVTTLKSSKDEIVDHACEVIDDQASQIARLREQQQLLAIACCVLVVWSLLF